MEDLFICLLDCENSWVPEWVCKLKIDSFRSNAHIGLNGTSTPTTSQAGSSFSSTIEDPESVEDNDDKAFKTMAVDNEAADRRCVEAKQRLEESLAKPKPTKKKGKIQSAVPPGVQKSKEPRSKRQAPITEKMKSMKEEEQAKAQKRKAKAVEQEEKGVRKKAMTAAAARAEKQLEKDRANEKDSDDDGDGDDDEEDDDVETTEQQDVLYTSPSSGKKYTKVYADEG